jgi:hypothetical protein
MSKQVVYSTRSVEGIDGRVFRNPRFFTAPEQGASKVFIDGRWPEIEEAYAKVGVPVEPISKMKALPGKEKSAEPNSQSS